MHCKPQIDRRLNNINMRTNTLFLRPSRNTAGLKLWLTSMHTHMHSAFHVCNKLCLSADGSFFHPSFLDHPSDYSLPANSSLCHMKEVSEIRIQNKYKWSRQLGYNYTNLWMCMHGRETNKMEDMIPPSALIHPLPKCWFVIIPLGQLIQIHRRRKGKLPTHKDQRKRTKNAKL